MPSKSIRKLAVKSRRSGRTNRTLRHGVLGLVDSVLDDHYGIEASTRCVQSSLAIQHVLDELGIRSTLWGGMTAWLGIYEAGDRPPKWVGFWGPNHHAYLVTEFAELVDLTITRLHDHPAGREPDMIDLPAMWWDDPSAWPPVLLYLPVAPSEARFEGDDLVEFELFMAEIRRRLAPILAGAQPWPAWSTDILEGPSDMDLKRRQGQQWVSRAAEFVGEPLQFPPVMRDLHALLRDGRDPRDFIAAQTPSPK